MKGSFPRTRAEAAARRRRFRSRHLQGQRRRRLPNMPREISRASAVPADFMKLSNADDPNTLSKMPPAGCELLRVRLLGFPAGAGGTGDGGGFGAGCPGGMPRISVSRRSASVVIGGWTGAPGPAAILPVNRSYADSRSTGSPYIGTSGEAATIADRTAGSEGAINDWGAGISVCATGVGAPFSDITVTTPSPIPSACRSSSRSYDDVGYVRTVAFSASASLGVNV